MDKTRTVAFALIGVLILVVSIFAASALTTWSRSLGGVTITTNSSFEVQYPLGTTLSPAQFIQIDPDGQVDNGQVFTYNYYVVNNGDVPITVTMNDNAPVNSDVSWNTDTNTLAVGSSILYILTLTINGQPGGAVSYSFTFDRV